ncbi:Wound-responsive family protein [Thalictrum thalictroides]|uniref:Wound-responsive family protein n=1 Tax=Thalictrum thalictroides TaxID=46969 RepID=A0A7J6W140_THATH|nr:Wound-responsive family protein [Thalictrum thalictroides]
MSSTSRASIAAATVGVVQGLKDQGLWRLNYSLRSIHQHVEKNLESISQSKRFSSVCSSSAVDKTKNVDRGERLKQSEESFRKVMYLSCWGPN